MAVEADAEKLVKGQKKAILDLFGMEIPNPPEHLLIVSERIRKEKLLAFASPFYLPRYHMAEGVDLPDLTHKLDSLLYEHIRAKKVDKDADWLPGEWIIFDTTKRPNYDGGKQMYDDTPVFKEMLTSLRNQHKIAVPDGYRHIPKASRFAISADEIDRQDRSVAKAVAGILELDFDEEVTTPPYATFNYIGNLAHPELGQVNTSEWFANSFRGAHRAYHLIGGYSVRGGLSSVGYWRSGSRGGHIGFRLQIRFPSKA